MEFSASQDLDILFVGVDELEVQLVLQFLQAENQAHFADSIEQARDLLSDTRPELVICEAERRGLDVRKLCFDQQLSSCIFLSSRDRDLEQRKCMLKVKECYLTRPYTAAQLHIAASVAQANDKLH
jgi:DNA-binding response OmpR family regulator